MKQIDTTTATESENLQDPFCGFLSAIGTPAALTAIPDGHIVDVNLALLRLCGCPRDALIGKHFGKLDLLSHPSGIGGMNGIDPIFSQALVSGKEAQPANFGSEKVLVKNFAGVQRPLILSRTKIEIHGLILNLILFSDPANQLQPLKDARNNDKQFYTIVQNAPIPIMVHDISGRIRAVNRTFTEITGYTLDDIPTVADWLKSACSVPDALLPAESIEFINKHAAASTIANEERTVRTVSGQERHWFFCWTRLDHIENGPLIILTALDITERKQAEKKLKEAHRRLEKEVGLRTAELAFTVKALEKEVQERKKLQSDILSMSRKSIDALESDRRSVSKEMQDTVAGSLAAIKFGLEGLLEKKEDNLAAAAPSIRQVIAHLSETIEETRMIATYLRSPVLGDKGLKAAVKGFVRQFEEFYPHIEVDFKIDVVEERLPASLQVVVYRVLQESLHNCAKHSSADQVRIVLRMTEEQLYFELNDNGRGCDIRQIEQRQDPLSGNGLLSMRDRVELCGGSFQMESDLNKGMTVRMSLPLDADLREETKQERQRLQAVLDALPVGVLLSDQSGRIVKANATINAIWGGKSPVTMEVADFSLQKGWWSQNGQLLGPGDWAMARALKDGQVSVGEVIDIERFDGTQGTILNSAAPIRNERGEITGAVAVIQDITEERRMQRERQDLIVRLEKALAEINTLRGIVPICASCKSIRDDKGYWNRIERYLSEHTQVELSHGLCRKCVKKLYPDLDIEDID